MTPHCICRPAEVGDKNRQPRPKQALLERDWATTLHWGSSMNCMHLLQAPIQQDRPRTTTRTKHTSQRRENISASVRETHHCFIASLHSSSWQGSIVRGRCLKRLYCQSRHFRRSLSTSTSMLSCTHLRTVDQRKKKTSASAGSWTHDTRSSAG